MQLGGKMVHYEQIDGKLACQFSHRLDSANCVKWEDGLYEKIAQMKLPVVFDLEKVNYVASAFLRICIKVSKDIGKDNLKITHACSHVKKVFKISGLDKQLSIK